MIYKVFRNWTGIHWKMQQSAKINLTPFQSGKQHELFTESQALPTFRLIGLLWPLPIETGHFSKALGTNYGGCVHGQLVEFHSGSTIEFRVLDTYILDLRPYWYT